MRPYVKSLDPDTLPWVPIFNTGVDRRFYNTDPKDKSFTCVIRVPKDWVGPSGAHYHSSFEEGYVVEGSLTLDGTDYLQPGSYLYRPAMIVHGWTELSPDSATVIVRRGGVADIVPVGPALHPYEYPYEEVHDGRKHVLHLKTDEMQWTATESGYDTKVLSSDRDNGDRSYLVSLPAGWRGELPRSHGRDLECVVLEGAAELDDATQLGRLHYLYRPPGDHQAPIVASKQGCKALVWEETVS